MNKINKRLGASLFSIIIIGLSFQFAVSSSEFNIEKHDTIISAEYKPNIDIPFEY